MPQLIHQCSVGFITLVFAALSPAETIEVPADHATIGAAISAAGDGDDIRISAGTYLESDLMLQSRNLRITGEVDAWGHPLVTIDGSGTSSILMGFGVVGSEGATVENIVFTGSVGNAVWIYHHAPTIRNCVFTGLAVDVPGGAVWAMDSEALFEGCSFTYNTTASVGSLFFSGNVADGEPGPTLRTSVFCGNASELGQVVGTWSDGGGNSFAGDCVDTSACAADLDGDGTVNGIDLSFILGNWGICGFCPADLNRDGAVDGADLTLILANWGGCEA